MTNRYTETIHIRLPIPVAMPYELCQSLVTAVSHLVADIIRKEREECSLEASHAAQSKALALGLTVAEANAIGVAVQEHMATLHKRVSVTL